MLLFLNFLVFKHALAWIYFHSVVLPLEVNWTWQYTWMFAINPELKECTHNIAVKVQEIS